MTAVPPTQADAWSAEMHRRIVETANEGVWQVDLDGRTVFANRRMAEMLGCAPEGMPGRAVQEFVFDGDRAAAAERLAWNIQHGRSDQFDFRFRRADGAAVDVLGCTSPVLDEDGRVLGALGMFIDITSRKRVERRLATQYAVASILAEAPTLQDAAPRLVRAICECLDSEFGAVWIVDPAERRLSCVNVWSAPGAAYTRFEALTRACAFPEGMGMPGRVWAAKSAQWIPDVVIDDNFPRAAIAAAEGLHGAFGFPIVLDGDVLGVIEFFSHEIRQPDAELLDMMTSIGSQIGQFAKRRRAEADLRDREQALREADRRKNEFLAMLAHELRNPLAPIRNALEVMRLPGLDQERRRWAQEIVERQMAQMVRLVDDLLDVSRISHGKLELRSERTDLAAVIAQAVETVSPLLGVRRHALSVRLPDERVALEADLARLAQVFANLLHNAAKYTPEGGRISLTAERDGDDVVVRVRDTGIGMSADMLPHIFDLFVQAQDDHLLDRSLGGLGVGLTLVKSLVELHGGRVEARCNEPPPGSEFQVRLPCAHETLPAISHVPEEAPSAARVLDGARRILIVDDNVDAAETLAMLLRLRGHEVRTAHDGLRGVEAAAGFRPEIAFVDIGLPGMDGYEVARHLRALPPGDAVLVALTGYGLAADRAQSKASGFDFHVVKPVGMETIRSLLDEAPPAAG